MLTDGFADGVDLIEGLLDGVWAESFAGDPDGEKDGGHTAFAHAWDVNVAIGVASGEIEIGIEEALGGVVVSVDDDGGRLELLGLR